MNTIPATRLGRRRGASRTDLLVSLTAGTVMLAAAVPLLARNGIDSGEARSLSNLRTLAAAHEAYSASFNGKQFGVMPENAGLVNGNCGNYLATVACPPQLLLGQSPTSSAWWGFFLGQYGLCAGSTNPPGSSCTSWAMYLPITFTASDRGLGSFRLGNATAFNSYVDGRFYSDTFYSPNDRANYETSARYRDAGVQFDSASGEIAFTSYCLSPAAMYHPAVLAESNGGYKNPNTFEDAFIAPTVSQCTHPELKTRLLEHTWNVGAPTSQFELDNSEPTFNTSLLASPLASFFDGHVTRLRNTQAFADDAAVRAGGGLGLWSRTTPFGEVGYWMNTVPPIEAEHTSHTILTIDGILGRDVLTPQ